MKRSDSNQPSAAPVGGKKTYYYSLIALPRRGNVHLTRAILLFVIFIHFFFYLKRNIFKGPVVRTKTAKKMLMLQQINVLDTCTAEIYTH